MFPSNRSFTLQASLLFLRMKIQIQRTQMKLIPERSNHDGLIIFVCSCFVFCFMHVMTIPKPAKPSRRMRGRRNCRYMLTHALWPSRQWCFYKFDLKYILIVFVFPVSDMIFKYLEAFLFWNVSHWGYVTSSRKIFAVFAEGVVRLQIWRQARTILSRQESWVN